MNFLYVCITQSTKSSGTMYDYIQGEVTELTPAYAVVEAGGVGYYLVISLQTYAELEHLSSARVYTHFAVREDAQTLYGFATREEREVFRLLVSVSGVGGNTARMILSTYSPAELANILATENAVLVKNVKGLGLKTAQTRRPDWAVPERARPRRPPQPERTKPAPKRQRLSRCWDSARRLPKKPYNPF